MGGVVMGEFGQEAGAGLLRLAWRHRDTLTGLRSPAYAHRLTPAPRPWWPGPLARTGVLVLVRVARRTAGAAHLPDWSRQAAAPGQAPGGLGPSPGVEAGHVVGRPPAQRDRHRRVAAVRSTVSGVDDLLGRPEETPTRLVNGFPHFRLVSRLVPQYRPNSWMTRACPGLTGVRPASISAPQSSMSTVSKTRPSDAAPVRWDAPTATATPTRIPTMLSSSIRTPGRNHEGCSVTGWLAPSRSRSGT